MPWRMSEWQMRILKSIVAPLSRWNARRYLASDGRSLGQIAGRDICVASMTGAKSGKRRDVPLMYVRPSSRTSASISRVRGSSSITCAARR